MHILANLFKINSLSKKLKKKNKKRSQLNWALPSCDVPCIAGIGRYQRYMNTSAKFKEKFKSVLEPSEYCQPTFLGYSTGRLFT